MDLRDKKLIYLLDINSREQEAKLAKELTTSKQVINYRIKKLIESKTILQCQTMLSIANLNTSIYAQIYGKFLDCNKKKIEEIISYLEKHNRVGYLALYGGKFDFSISIIAKDMQDFDIQLNSIFKKYSKELREYVISMRIFNKRYPRTYLINSNQKRESKETFNKTTSKYKIDELDKKILEKITKNSRISMLEISEQTKEAFSTIRTRLKKLESEKIIAGYTLLIDLPKIDIQTYKLFIKTRNQSEETTKKILSFSETHPNIPWMQKTFGDHDYELRIEVETQDKLQEIIRQLREDFSDIIEEIETNIIFKEIKEDYGILLND